MAMSLSSEDERHSTSSDGKNTRLTQAMPEFLYEISDARLEGQVQVEGALRRVPRMFES